MKKSLGIVVLLLLFPLWLQAGGRNHKYTITAHSGSYGTPDNSMEYIETALANKDEILEFDVRCRPDGSLAMSHDEIKSNEDGVDIAVVLRKIKGHTTRVNLDIKETRALPALYQTIRELKMQQQVFYTGIEQKDIEAVKQSSPDIVFYLNCKPDIEQMKQPSNQDELLQLLQTSGVTGINISYKYCTKQLVKLLHSHGYQLSIWTVNEREDMVKYSKLHPDNITTRHPDLLRKIRDGK